MCSRITVVNIIFSFCIFLSRTYIFWLQFSAWLLWIMSIWLLMYLLVLPGRQSCLNCCMPLEHASLMELLESQSVSVVFSLSNIPAWTSRAALMMQQTALVWWRHQWYLFHASFRNPAEMTFYVNVCWVCFCVCRQAALVKQRAWWNMTAMHSDSYRDLISQTVTT